MQTTPPTTPPDFLETHMNGTNAVIRLQGDIDRSDDSQSLIGEATFWKKERPI